VETEVVVTIGILQRELGPMQTRAGGNENHSFSDALFWMRAVAPSVGLFGKLATKPTKPQIDLSP
jgi:hypothetical protein